MVRRRPHRAGAGRQPGQRRGDDTGQLPGVQAGEHEREVEGELQLVVVAVEARQPVRAVHPGLAEQQARGRVAVRDPPPAAVDLMRLRAVRAVVRPLAELARQRAGAGLRRVVAQFRVLVEAVRHVDAEPGHAAVEPEPEDLVERLVHPRLPPVQVGLAGQEIVQVVLLRRLMPGPGRAAGGVQPVVRRRAARARVGPDVEVPVRRVAAGRRVDEPGMGRACVVGHQVEQHPQAAFPRLGDQPVHLVHGAELGMHAQVVGDVVAPVLIRRGHGRRQPDAVDAEPGQVVKPRDDAAEVAEAVAVGVQPGPDVQLIERRAVPPAGPAVFVVHRSPGR